MATGKRSYSPPSSQDQTRLTSAISISAFSAVFNKSSVASCASRALPSPLTRMPLSDFKQLETGYYVVWLCRYKTPAHVNKTREARKDPQMAKHDYYEPRFLSSESAHAYQDRHIPRDRVRISWHKSEAAAKAVFDVLSKEVVPYEWGMLDGKATPQLHNLEISKEVCVFDGDEFHSLSGKRWPLADVETCIARFERASADEILQLYGKHRRARRPCWQIFLCWATCLCCFDGYFGCSRRA